MKKVSLMIAALALVLGLSQCKKEEKPAASGVKQHIVLNASFGDSNSKIAEDGIGGLKWAEGDVINVFKGEQSLSEDGLTCTNPENGIFEGEIATTTGNITFTFGTQNFDGQSGLLNDAISLTSGEVEYKADGNYNVRMTMPHAVLKLDLSAFADDTKGAGVTVTITSGEEPLASVTGITANSKAVYVALPADGTGSKKYTFNNGKGMNAEKTWPLAANTFYTKNGSTTGEAIVIPAYPVGALPGLFTVNSSGKQVYFSKGNLQCVKNGSTWDNTCTWQFAAKQWETVETGNVSADYANESVIGLFGWGTSGYNYGATYYQPWSTNGSPTAYGPSSGNLTLDGNSDWGKNIGDGKTWRTLTKDEWVYLINTRKVNGAMGYGNTCVRARVEGVKGLIIFPDGYTGATSGLTSIPEGCVFLPAAGYRYGTSVRYVGELGYYWSSSYYYSNDAYNLYFDGGGVDPNDDGFYRNSGFSVRLVSEN